MKLTVEQVVELWGGRIELHGWGRYRIAEFLNEEYDDTYSTYFGRQVAEAIAERVTGEPTEPLEPHDTPTTNAQPSRGITSDQEAEIHAEATYSNAVNEARLKYGLGPEWEPKKVWGDGQVSFAKAEDMNEATEVMQDFLQKIAGYAPDYEGIQNEKTKVNNPFGNYMAVMGLKDVHFGKLAHRDEAGEDYDLKIAMKRWKSAALQLLAKIQHTQTSKVIIPIGSDALHVNGGTNATIKGTEQDVDGRWWKAFDEACHAYRWLIEHILALPSVQEVHAVAVPGNHGGEFELALARWVQAWFRQVDSMTHDVRPLDRKYVLHGQTLIGFTHGENIKLPKLPQVMAVDVPELWGASTYREFHTDHRHHRGRQLASPGDYEEFPGVMVTINPALCGPGKWSYEHGFVGSLPSAQVSIYDDYGQEWLGWAKIRSPR